MTILGAFMGFLLFSGATKPVPAPVAAPSVPSYPVTLTAYNAVPEQTDDDPFVTASGAYSNPEVVAARSRDLASAMPFGTIIEIDGTTRDEKNTCGYHIVSPIIGYRVIADTMNARYTNRIDVLFSTQANYTMPSGSVKNAGTILGICGGVTVRVVGFVDISRPANLPKTQLELAALVTGGRSTLALK